MIQNASKISGQFELIAFMAKLSLIDSRLVNATFNKDAIDALETEIIISGSELSNLSNNGGTSQVIRTSLGSKVSILDTSFS